MIPLKALSLPDMTVRSVEREKMDRRDSSKSQLFRTLEQFRWINRFFSSAWRPICRHVLPELAANPQRRWTFLDVGGGGGDLAIRLARHCRRYGIPIDITLLDYDPRVVEFARKATSAFPEIRVKRGDALQLDRQAESYDFVFANHLLHHLTDEQIVSFLQLMPEICHHTCLLNDIIRKRSSYLVYTLLAGCLFRDSFILEDGRLSIRKGFRREEAVDFVDRAGLNGVGFCTNGVGHFYLSMKFADVTATPTTQIRPY